MSQLIAIYLSWKKYLHPHDVRGERIELKYLSVPGVEDLSEVISS